MWALLAILGVILIAEVIWLQHRQSFQWLGENDFIEYWSAGQLLRKGHNPYDFEALYAVERGVGWSDDMPLVMWNPPWLLVLLYPLLMLPFGIAATLWLVLSTGILLGCTMLIWTHFVKWTLPAQLILPLLATVAFTPVLFTLRMGQVSVLLLLGVVGFLHFEDARNDWLAGTFLTLLTLKPHVTYLLWIAIVWWIITRRRWKVLLGLGSVLALLCVAMTPLRPTWALDYGAAMLSPPLYWQAPVLGTLLRMLFGWDRTWLQYVPSLVAGVLVLIALNGRRITLEWRDIAGPLLLLSVPTAAYGWSFDHLVLLLPYLQMVSWLSELRHRNLSLSLVMAAALLLTSGLMLWVNFKLKDDLYLLWGPLVWSLLYLACRRMLRSNWSGALPVAMGRGWV
jgi:hypothetical protein